MGKATAESKPKPAPINTKITQPTVSATTTCCSSSASSTVAIGGMIESHGAML